MLRICVDDDIVCICQYRVERDISETAPFQLADLTGISLYNVPVIQRIIEWGRSQLTEFLCRVYIQFGTKPQSCTRASDIIPLKVNVRTNKPNTVPMI